VRDIPSNSASVCLGMKPSSSTVRIRSVKRHGANLVILENRRIRVTIWPEHGAAILGFEDIGRKLDVMWKNAMVQPPRLHPLGQPMERNSDLYDVLDGSWFLSLPTGWFPADYFGAPVGAHGEFRSIPFEVEILEQNRHLVRLRAVGKSVRTPFVIDRIWTLERDSEVLEWEEVLTNRSNQPRPCAWLQHPAFAGELVRGAELRLPAKTIATYNFNRPMGSQITQGYKGTWPHIPESTGGVRDCSKVPEAGSGQDHSVQATDLAVGWGCVWNQKMRRGFALRWDEKLFPWAWSWARGGGSCVPPVGEDYPLWGQGPLITLQPSTSPVGPFAELVASKQVATVPAQGSMRTRFLSGFCDQPDEPWQL